MVQKLRKFRWSFKQERKLLQLVTDSRPLEEIADRVRRSSVAVRAMIGISFRTGATGDQGLKSATERPRLRVRPSQALARGCENEQ
jgi:hypothetical protein